MAFPMTDSPSSSTAPSAIPWRLLAAALLPLLIAGHTATWWTVTSRIEAALPGIAAAAAVDGWQLQWGTPVRSGWPLAATLRLPAPAAASAMAGGLRWTAEHLDVSIHPTAPGTLRLQPSARQMLTAGAAEVTLQTAETSLLVPLDNEGPATFHIRGLNAATASGVTMTATGIDARFDSTALRATAAGVAVLPPLPAPFDGGADLSLGLLASRPIPPATAPGGPAAAWRDMGGRLSVPALSVSWGPLRIDGQAEGELDRDTQPAFRATLRVQGAAETLDALTQANRLQPGPASAMRAVLGLLSLAAKGGPLTLPVVLQDRTVTVAQFPLLRLPPMGWTPQ